jgi:hypothetical protein
VRAYRAGQRISPGERETTPLTVTSEGQPASPREIILPQAFPSKGKVAEGRIRSVPLACHVIH